MYSRQKIFKDSIIIYVVIESLLEKITHGIRIQKNLLRQLYANIEHVATHYFYNYRLIEAEANAILQRYSRKSSEKIQHRSKKAININNQL